MDYSDSMRASLEYFGGEELPAKVFVDKYALRDNDDNFVEATPDDMHKRIASELARIEQKKFKVPYSYDEIYSWIKRFGYICPQGSPMYGIGNPYQSVTLSNCYVIHPPLDSYGGIHKTDEEISQISKRRGGCGTDISHIRPKDTPTKNSSKKSTGIIPFMERFSNSIREVGQDGRRGALMLTLNVHHPEVLNFAQIKKDRSKITGANLSISLTDEFLKAVKANKDYEQRWPVEGPKKFSRMVNAREVWKKIIECAWDMAEPGLLFWDKIISESPADCYSEFGFKTVSTNPCISKNTWILTNKGPKQVSDLLNKKFTAIVNGRTYESTNSGFFKTGTKQLYEITTKHGFKLECTENHEIQIVSKLTRNIRKTEFKSLKDLKIGDSISLGQNVCSAWYSGVGDRDRGWLVGNLLGDGCFSENTCKLEYWDEEKLPLWDYAKRLVKENFNHRSDFGSGTDDSYNVLVKNKKTLKSVELCNFANNSGLNKDKTLDIEIEKQSMDFYRGFISGWFDADGTVHPDKEKGNYVSLSSSILPNLEIAQRMLARLGIISTIYKNRKEAGIHPMPDGHGGYKSVWCNASHDLRISKSNLVIFANTIGFANPNKQNKLIGALSSYSRKYNRERHVDTIVSIIPTSIQDVYDATIPEISSFDANGIIVHNCSELPLSILDSCRLLFLNLFKFVKNPFTKNARFDFDEFYIFAQRAQRLMDDIVCLELESIDKIIAKLYLDPEPEEVKAREIAMWQEIRNNCFNGRRTGTGITALGDTLAAIGIGYGTKKSIEVTERIYQTLKFGCYRSSVDMAKELGPFPIWNNDLEKDNDFLNRMFKEQIETNNEDLIEITEIENGVEKHFIRGGQIMMEMEVFGRRNIALLTTAPVGSGSMVVELGMLPISQFIIHGSSSGIEPAFMLEYMRRKKNNPSDKGSRVDFIDQSGDSWQEFTVYHPALRYWMEVTGEKDITKSPWYGYCADDIDWKNRVKLQAAAQRHIDHAISSTINLPENVPQEKVAEIYEAAWEHGLKGITVYRKNCRSGVLVDLDSKQKDDKLVKRPKELKCDIFHIKVQEKEYFVLVGLDNKGSPYELLAAKNGKISKKAKHGKITKIKRGCYKLEADTGEILESVTDLSTDNEEAITRLVSTSLRSGVKIEYIVDQLEKVAGTLHCFAKSTARALKKYIKDGTKVHGEKCQECESELVRIEGCKKCPQCGWSKC